MAVALRYGPAQVVLSLPTALDGEGETCCGEGQMGGGAGEGDRRGDDERKEAGRVRNLGRAERNIGDRRGYGLQEAGISRVENIPRVGG